MAGASEKARFYLEKYVPELQEYERKGIFTHEEITSIAAKRSDFEHTLNARGSKPSDYVRYTTYEMNLDSLRKKRSKRLGVKSSNFSGQRTVFFILDRGAKKFPGDMGLWMQYIQFCQREKANKKLTKVFTHVLRLKPREWGLWVLAAKHYSENQGDITTARSYMQRGLRFCKEERKLWLEYLRLEMAYLAKLAARRKILGLDEATKSKVEDGDANGDMIMLPAITTAEADLGASAELEEFDKDTLQRFTSTPAFTGAIPIAILDAATKQFTGHYEFVESCFELVADFDQTPAARKILQHILDYMQENFPDSAESILCEARMTLFGIESTAVEFPSALGSALVSLKVGTNRLENTYVPRFVEKVVLMLLPRLRKTEDMDEGVVTVLKSSVRRYLRILAQGKSARGSIHEDPSVKLLERLRKDGKDLDAGVLEELSGTASKLIDDS